MKYFISYNTQIFLFICILSIFISNVICSHRLKYHDEASSFSSFSNDFPPQSRIDSPYNSISTKRRYLTDEDDWYSKGNGSNTVFVQADLNIARQRGNEVFNLIHQRWEFNMLRSYQYYLGSSNLPTRTWDMMKYKIALKTLENMSMGKKGRFLMIFGGSSVTAGHDNYFNQSYPMVFNRRMRPIFDALGIELVVRNIAQGANGCRPSDLCYEAMGGFGAEWVGWEQSFNCKGGDIFELMAKLAILNRGMLHISASGAFLPDCAMSNDSIPWASEEWIPDKVNITDIIIPTSSILATIRQNLTEWYEDGNSIGRFSGHLRGQYDGAAIHGYSVWARGNKYRDDNNTLFSCDAYCARPFCQESGGPHWMSGQTAIYGAGGGKKWHPSAGMHLQRGEFMAFNYLSAILDGMDMIEHDMKTSNASSLIVAYQAVLDSLYIPPPEKNIHCWHEECGYRAKCYTDFTPNYNPTSLLDRIIIGNHTGWEWKLKLGNGNSHPMFGYLDHKPGYESAALYAQISFRIDIPRNLSLVMVCGTEKDSLKHASFYIDVNTTSYTGSEYYLGDEMKNRTLHHNVQYRGDECFNLWEVPEGRHVLTAMTGGEGHRQCITHIITFD